MSRIATLAALSLVLAACSQADAPEATESEAPAADATPSHAEAETDVQHFLLQEFPEVDSLDYALAWSDLDGDGNDEAIVHLVGPYFCGTGGCTTLVLTQAGPMWRKVGDISVSRTPITVLDTSTNGWRDLTVAVSGGGMAGGNALLKFDGEAYPSNPTVEPAEMTEVLGTELLPEEPTLVTLEAALPEGN
ncbi:MAG: hypothetical protein KDE15_14215 [Erythrobacter sp.]|nr:hypothetical protein [Erythrobacter sp.]